MIGEPLRLRCGAHARECTFGWRVAARAGISRFILLRMFAVAAPGEKTAEQGVADAEAEIKAIFEKWRERGKSERRTTVPRRAYRRVWRLSRSGRSGTERLATTPR